MPRRPRSTSNTIAFRSPAELLAKLDQDATRLEMSRGELVRAIVVLHYESQPGAVREDLEKLLQQLSLLRRNQARSLVSLLVHAGHLSLEEAKAITRADLVS